MQLGDCGYGVCGDCNAIDCVVGMVMVTVMQCDQFLIRTQIDTSSTRLNCILQDLFRDAPLDHIWHAQIRAQIRPNGKIRLIRFLGAYLGTPRMVKWGCP